MPPKEPARLFLVDGYALIYRAFFALISRPLTTSRGENTSAAWGVVNFLQRLLATHRPDYLGWVHDSGLSFRHERYPDYKATREKLGEELQADFDRGMERIGSLLDAYKVPVITLKGYEADDVIGTMARLGVDAGLDVIVVSGDKDFQQLVRPGVRLLNPGRGGSAGVEEHWVTTENASERLGVPADRVTDYLALVGDSSDNIPGVKGIGDKTAVELVATFGSLENILANAESITKKRPREALLTQADAARLSKELVTIREDLPVSLDLPALAISEPDHARLKELFVELEFHALAKEHATAAPRPVERARYVTVDTLAALEKVCSRARAVPYIAVDTETVVDPDSPLENDPLRSKLVGLSIAIAPGEAYYLPFRHRSHRPAQQELLPDSAPPTGAETTAAAIRNLPPIDSAELAPLRALLEDPTVRKTAQNSKFDSLVLRKVGVRLAGVDFDTMIASYVLDPSRRSHGLDVLALEFLDHKMTTYDDLCGKGRNAVPYDECAVSAARDYACEDADMALQLRAVFEPQLEAYALTKLIREIELPLVSVLAEMEWQGVSIDRPWFASLKERFQRERERVEQEIYEAAGEPFNINSNPRLRQILFEKLELPVLKRTPSGPSTDASVLQQLAEQGHVLPSLLMEYRELSKLEGTYLDALPALVHPGDGRIHTSFNQTVASTGRLSSSDPNLQNIPIRRELGRDIRRGFIPRPGWKLLAADYSQIELRLLAHLSADAAFVNAFRAGGDIHRQTASIIFGVPIEEVTSDMRARAKTINFATIYGQGANALSRQLRIEPAEARRFISEYFERFRGIRVYLDSRIEFAREHGYVQTLFGRRRYITELRDRNFSVRQFGERTATNSPIQGSAADLIKIAMIRIHEALRSRGARSIMILQVHDELVFEAPTDEIESLRELVSHEMAHAAELSVPLVVDIGVGDNWLDTKR
ncbi:MAG TPA: DNA polymerase I [Gemmatimonadaceae bacterium]|jgi:DNA polymerase-1|nr:DNA polymerase I [Gemmatimonadaceae bacterium]